MAAIEKIRKRSGLLIAIIGLALLAFVLQDLFQSTGRHREYNVAVIDGEKIPYKDFEDLKNKNMENMKRSYGTNLTSAQTYNVYNSTLEQMIKDNIMTKEYNAVGMHVTAEELYDQFVGEEPHQWVVQNFSDANGNFDRATLENYMQNLDNAPVEYRNQWVEFENAIKENRLESKFDNLVKASFYLPKRLADKYNETKNTKATADVVVLRYASIPDSTVTVTDQDKKSYYEDNKYRFETDETRAIDYVVFEINPSEEDDQSAKQFVESMKEDFTNTENVINFVNANSDLRYDSTWLGRPDVPAVAEEMLFAPENEPGFVYGPYFDQNSYNLIRLVDRQVIEDSLMVRVAILRHELSPSTKTYQNTFAKANKFVTENRTLDQFNTAIETEGLTKRTQPRLTASTYQIAGIDNPRQIVRWAFEDKTKVGDVSTIFELDNMFVVAALTEIIPEGYAPLEKVAEQSKYPILNKKKGEIAVERMKACGTDYNRMVSELGAENTTVSDISMESRSVGNFGIESDVIGIIMGMKEGEVVGPIAGNSSAFVIKNVKRVAPAALSDYSNIEREKKAQFDNKVFNGGVYNALRNNAKIEDNRVLFY
ncbi:MAG: SurA N-terminal domain-containing protein [Bacteroidales bacterium]|nr:SurA N-terminal domain-containing protein [Bacteroidales bacterium]